MLLGVDCEDAVIDEGKILPILIVIYRNDQWCVCFLPLCQLVWGNSLQFEVKNAKNDFLFHPGLEVHGFYVVLLVGCIKHYRHIISIFLLSDTAAYTDITWYFGVDLERQLQ